MDDPMANMANEFVKRFRTALKDDMNKEEADYMVQAKNVMKPEAHHSAYFPTKDGPPPMGRVAVGDLVCVTWLDSHHRSGWSDDPPQTEPWVVRSVGWIVADTLETIVLEANVIRKGSPQRCGEMTIPKRSITVTQILELPSPL